VGERFGPFELIEPLGRGGMAEVWRALYRGESGFAKEVALKRILPERRDQPNLVTWFHDEARLCSRLKHLNIVEVYDFGTIEQTPYMSMEFVQGWTLSQVLRRCRARGDGLPVPAVIELGIQTCAGLAYAHTATDADGAPLGVIHRDLKPANLMISADGLVKVMDFGIAKATTNEFRTETDSVRGTPSYLSPEACDGRAVDPRADLFTLGAILVEALLGYPLFLEENTYRTMYRIAQADVDREIAEVRALDPGTADVLQRALLADPAERYADADAMRFALQAISEPGRGPEALLGSIRKALAQPDPGADADLDATAPGQRTAPRTELGPPSTGLLTESAATHSWEEPETPGEPDDSGGPTGGEVEADWRRARRRSRRWVIPVVVGGAVVAAAAWFVPPLLLGEQTQLDQQDSNPLPGPGDAAETPGTTTAPAADEAPTPPADSGSSMDEPEDRTAGEAATPGFTLSIPDEAEVGRALQTDPALRSCFQQSRDRGEAAPPAVGLVFRMGPDGTFETVRVTDSVPATLEQCLTTRLRQMQFGKSSFQWEGRATLAYLPVPDLPAETP